jgi:hypothetical protein
MQYYSENQIREIHAEFRGLKKYIDKLAFFDRLFGIIPFSFPDFDPQLRYFFQNDKTEELEVIFKKERNNPGLTEKKFSFGETFVFNIKPANSNSSVYSNFILSSFLSCMPVFEDWIRQKKSAERPIEFFLDEANGIVNRIEYYLHYEYDKSFKLQCMSVFYKGFYDAFCNHVNLPGKKRKFIELFLYAQGIIYANYISSLKSAFENSRNPAGLHKPLFLDLSGKLGLMNDLGILELLRARFGGLNTVSFENKMAETLCLITGEYADQKESVLKILSTMKKQSPGEMANRELTGVRRKIPETSTGK